MNFNNTFLVTKYSDNTG